MFYSKTTGGFYHPSIHGASMPVDVAEISNKYHEELLAGQAAGKNIVPDEKGFPVLADFKFSFDSALNAKNSEIKFAFQKAMSPITANYTAEDIASFPTQEAEAKAWNENNYAPTPLLDFMLANRPTIDKETLVSRIIGNSVAYKQIAGPAIGKKQYLEDQLYALKAQHEDPEQPVVIQADFDAIVVDFS